MVLTPVQVNSTDKFHTDWPGNKPETPRSEVINFFKITFPLYPQEIFFEKKNLIHIQSSLRLDNVQLLRKSL